jgi:site-specific recombinase XerD
MMHQTPQPPSHARPAQPPTTDTAGLPQDLLDQAAGYALRSRAPATIRAYDSDWRHFAAWCADHQATALPAGPRTVAAYLTAHAGKLTPSTLRRRLAAISTYHQAAGRPNATTTIEVRLVWHGIAREHPHQPRQAEPAGTGTVRALVATLDDRLGGRRDRALLLMLFAAAMCRSELVALDIADIEEVPQGLEVLIRQPARQYSGPEVVAVPRGDHPETCPVRAWLAWLASSGLTDGPAFRPVDRHGNVGPDRLHDQAVTRIIKRVAARAQLDPTVFSAHSLRAGLAVAALAAGVPEDRILVQGRWRSRTALLAYKRRLDLWRDVAAAHVGL